MFSLIVFLLIFPTTLGVWMAWCILRSPEPPLVAFARELNRLYCTWIYGLKIPPEDPLPEKGPVILVSNHTCPVDPCLLQACTGRVISFMMGKEFYEMRTIRWLANVTGSIPTRRDGRDVAAIKRAMSTLKEGGVLGIFPQGRIMVEGVEEELKHGVAMIALHANVPIVPARIEGTPSTTSIPRAALTPSRARIRFGKPFRLPPLDRQLPRRQAIEAATAEIMRRSASLGDADETV